MKKALVVLLIIVLVGGWIISVQGIQIGNIKIEPINKLVKLGLDLKGGVYVVMEAETDATGEELRALMSQTQHVIERRVNAMGLSEPNVLIEGEKRIRIELPGVKNSTEAIEAIGKTAQLEFIDHTGKVILTGKDIKNAGVMYDERNMPAVSLEMTSEGAEVFREATRIAAAATGEANIIAIVLDGEIISAPGVRSEIPNGKAQISGSRTIEEAATLAGLIRGGALPVTLKEVRSSVIGATLGIDAMNQSVFAGILGIGLIIIFMLIMYRLPGIASGIALLLYILIVVWILVGFKYVLTLPGMAGIILSVGMAVDANVIIFERIKEEIQAGKSVRAAVNSGSKRALSTIIDSNITTLIAGIVLYQFGTGPVRGFSVTLMIGILTSLFTAVVITRLILSALSGVRGFNNPKFYGVKEGSK